MPTDPSSVAPVRHDHPDTSRVAARAVSGRAPRLRAAVLDAIRFAGPAGVTDEELIDRLPSVSSNTLRPRRVELVRLGEVCDSGLRRKTSSGRAAIVWVATGAAS